MRILIILLLMAAPATAAGWDLNNLTPSQRSSLIIMRDRWNNGYRGTPRCPPCSGVKHVWYDGKVKDAKPAGGRRRRAPDGDSHHGGGPLTILNPYVSKEEGGSGVHRP